MIEQTATTTLDSATDPDDTTVLAAPGARKRANVIWLMIAVKTPQTDALIAIEKGSAGGATLVAVAADATATFYIKWPDRKEFQLDVNEGLNATIEGATGVVATVTIASQIRGG